MWRLAIGVAAAVLSLQLLPAECKTFQITKELSIGTSLCPGQPNTNVPWTGTPTLVKEVANGSLYTVGEDDDLIYGRNRRCKVHNIATHVCRAMRITKSSASYLTPCVVIFWSQLYSRHGSVHGVCNRSGMKAVHNSLICSLQLLVIVILDFLHNLDMAGVITLAGLFLSL